MPPETQLTDRCLPILKRLLAMVFVYAGLADDGRAALACLNAGVAAGGSEATGRAFSAMAAPTTLPRWVHRMAVRLLLPIEAAARRLIVAVANDTPTPQLQPWEIRRIAAPRPARPAILPRSFAPGVMVPLFRPAPRRAGCQAPGQMPRFSLLDPLKRADRRPPAGRVARPLVIATGETARAVYSRTPKGAVGGARLIRRVTALAGVLDDIPRAANRLARWRAFRDARLHHQTEEDAGQSSARSGADLRGTARQRRALRTSPLRTGRPPGSPPLRLSKNRWREEHALVVELHALALAHRPDTS